MPNDSDRNQNNEDKTIELILESLHTLQRLSHLHQKKLRDIANDTTSSPQTKRSAILEEAHVARTITTLTDNSLKGFTGFLNRYYE